MLSCASFVWLLITNAERMAASSDMTDDIMRKCHIKPGHVMKLLRKYDLLARRTTSPSDMTDDVLRKCFLKPGHVMELVKKFESYESARRAAEPGGSKTFRRRPTRIVFAGVRTPERGYGNRSPVTPPGGTAKVAPGTAVVVCGRRGSPAKVSVRTQTVDRFYSGVRGDFVKCPTVSIIDEIPVHGIAYAPEFNRTRGKSGRVRCDVSYGPNRTGGFGDTGTLENVFQNEPRFAGRIGCPARTSERRVTTMANFQRKVPEYLRPGFVKRSIERFENGVCFINVL